MTSYLEPYGYGVYATRKEDNNTHKKSGLIDGPGSGHIYQSIVHRPVESNTDIRKVRPIIVLFHQVFHNNFQMECVSSIEKMMMTKYATLIALLGVMTICWAQSSSYQYSAVLDTEGEFLMRWNIWPVQKDVEMRFEVKTQGWLSLLLASADASYADVFFGGYDDANSKGYLGV